MALHISVLKGYQELSMFVALKPGAYLLSTIPLGVLKRPGRFLYTAENGRIPSLINM
jgi:hypothetical protein